MVGAHTSYVERTNLTSRQMNGRLVRKTLSFSKELEMLTAASTWEDGVYNLTRTVKTLRVETAQPGRRYERRSPAMAAGLTDHLWTIKELLWTVVPPTRSTQNGQTTRNLACGKITLSLINRSGSCCSQLGPTGSWLAGRQKGSIVLSRTPSRSTASSVCPTLWSISASMSAQSPLPIEGNSC